ncbi:MAG: M48 family peptidase [Ignavibacteriae bacterium]|nr:MAG: M48 family peptidase [Ignavibacteriota bacterium]
MKLPDNYTILFKDVKHVGIRVSHDQRVRIVAPHGLPERHLEEILRRKTDWIQKHLHRMRTRTMPVPLAQDQILLKGKIFLLTITAQFKNKIVVDEEHLTIRAGNSFLVKKRQQTWYKNEARKYFEYRVRERALHDGFSFNNIFIRSQKTRWGSCSKKKNLSFNWKLIKAPLFVIEYLILHELVHTEYMNHSRQYWQNVQSLCPDYKIAGQWLKEHGREL